MSHVLKGWTCAGHAAMERCFVVLVGPAEDGCIFATGGCLREKNVSIHSLKPLSFPSSPSSATSSSCASGAVSAVGLMAALGLAVAGIGMDGYTQIRQNDIRILGRLYKYIYTL